MATVGTLFVNVSARTEQLITGLAKARAAINRFGASMVTGKVLGFGAAITAAATALGTYYLHQQASAIDRTHKLARSLGVATEAMGGLTYAAKLSGIGSEQVATTMQRLARVIGDAVNGSKSAAAALAQIGLQASDLSGLGLDEALALVSDRLAGLTSPAARASAAVAIFGRSGAALLPWLGQGGDAMRALSAEAIELGAAIGGPAASKVEAANDSLTRLKTILEGVANTILVEAAPYIVQLGNELTAAAKASNGFGAIVRDAFRSAVPVIAYAYDVIRSLGVAFNVLKSSVATFGATYSFVVSNVLTGAHYLTLGLTGLGDAARELRAVSADLWRTAGEARDAVWDGIDAMATNPVTEFAARAQKLAAELESMGDAARSSASAIDALAGRNDELGAGMDSAFDAADKLAQRLYDQARTFGMSAREAEIYLATVNGATEAQVEYLHMIDAWLTAKEQEAEALRKAREEAERNADANLDLIRSLEEQVATFGMSAAEIDLYRAAMRGASEEQLEQIRNLHALLDAKREEAELAKAVPVAIAEAAKLPESIGVETALGTLKLPGVTDAVSTQELMLTEAEKQTGYLQRIAEGDRTGSLRPLDGAAPVGLVRVEDVMVSELRRANDSLAKIDRNTALFGRVLT